MANGFFLVVIALDQVFASDVVLAFDLGRVVLDVVGTARGQVHTAACHAANDLFVVHGDLDHRIDVHARSDHGLCLRDGAWETVEQATVGAIRLGDALFDQADDQLVGDQLAGIHDFFQLQAQGRAGLDRRTQHVTGGNLWNTELFGDELCLSTFTGPGSSQQNYAHLVLLKFLYAIQWIRQPGPSPEIRYDHESVRRLLKIHSACQPDKRPKVA